MTAPTKISTAADEFRARAAAMADRAAAGDLPTDLSPWPSPDLQVARGPAPLPARFASAHVGQLDGDVGDLADEWTDGGMSANVLLLGAIGTGKTHTACALARQAWEAGSGVMFLPVVELLDQLRPDGRPDAMHRTVTVDVLVLDDLGGERPTDWTGERLYAVINRRWLEQRPTLVTSNLDSDALEKASGPRVFSRLYHGALRLEVGGPDRRREG